MSSEPEPAIWSRDTCQRIPCFDSCQLTMDAKYQRSTYGNGATLLFFKVLGLAYGRRCGQSRDNQNFLDRWVTKFSKVWGSAIKYTK